MDSFPASQRIRRRCSCIFLSYGNDLHNLTTTSYETDGRKGSLPDHNQRTFILKRSFTFNDLTLIRQWKDWQDRWKNDKKLLYQHDRSPYHALSLKGDFSTAISSDFLSSSLAVVNDVDVLDCRHGQFDQQSVNQGGYLLEVDFKKRKEILSKSEHNVSNDLKSLEGDVILSDSFGKDIDGQVVEDNGICPCNNDNDPLTNKNLTKCVKECTLTPKCEVTTILPVGSLFAMKVKKLESWFDKCDDNQRNYILKGLLDRCKVPQMHMLSMVMAPILHKTCPFNCEDMLTWFPSHIAFKVLSYLDPVSLCRCSLVNRSWYRMANDSKLWVRLCRQPQWIPSEYSNIKQNVEINDDSQQNWKVIFGERYRLYRNWMKGYCSIRKFEGHSQGISCVKFDDSRIVTSSYDKKVKVWDIRTNSPWSAMTLTGHTGTVRCMDLKDNRLVTGSCDCTIKVWDLHMSQTWSSVVCRATLLGHQHTVRCLQMEGDYVISGSYDRTLRIWDIRTRTCTKILWGHEDCVLCLHYVDNLLASGSYDCTIKIWNVESGICLNTLEGHERAVTCLKIANGQIISGSVDRNIMFWDFHTGECIRKLDWITSEGHTAPIRCLQADHWRVVSAADDKTIKVWCLKSGKRLATFVGHQDGVTHLQFNDRVIVSGSYDTSVRLWDFSVC